MTNTNERVQGVVPVRSLSDAEAMTDANKGAQGGSLDVVGRDLPALSQALAISQIAVAAGFEWEDEAGVWDKVAEEVEEFKEASTKADRLLEFGDVLFSLVNVARWNGIDPEEALKATCDKFRRRWAHMEQSSCIQGRSLDGLRVDQLEALWQEAKRAEREAAGSEG